MTGPGKSTEENQLTLLGRLTGSLVGRRWGLFAAELVLVVTGILVALAIDGWISDLHDRQTEAVYLELLSRDISEVRQQAETQAGFEKDKLDIGIEAYAILVAAEPGANPAHLGKLLGALSTRRTLNLTSATFDQIISSGHLQLIRNRELRDHLVQYFADMERLERITGKNNQDLIDDIYLPFLMRVGITRQIHPQESVSTLNRANEILVERLGEHAVMPEDRVLSEPPGSDSWNDIRRNLLFRMLISAIGQANAESILDDTDEMAAAIASEINGD